MHALKTTPAAQRKEREMTWESRRNQSLFLGIVAIVDATAPEDRCARMVAQLSVLPVQESGLAVLGCTKFFTGVPPCERDYCSCWYCSWLSLRRRRPFSRAGRWSSTASPERSRC